MAFSCYEMSASVDFMDQLTLSLLMPIQEGFIDSVDQDQTAQNVLSDLWSILSIILIQDYN